MKRKEEKMSLRYLSGAGVFVLKSTYEQRAAPQAAGFYWHPTAANCRWSQAGKKCRMCSADKYNVWWTPDVVKAIRLEEYASGARTRRMFREYRESLHSSEAVDADVDIPVPDGKKYFPFQKAGIAFSMGRPATLFGDEMGLGKTIQAIGRINADDSVKSVLVICPANLKHPVWNRHLPNWLVRPMTVAVIDGSDSDLDPECDILVINYEMLHKCKQVSEREWDVVIIDECHYMKNPKARRSLVIRGGAYKRSNKAVASFSGIKARIKLALTGTPIVNRPKELFPIINYLDPKSWPSFFGFAKRYCGAVYNGFGWDFSGATNLDELQEKLRSTIMVRRLKRDVLKELPAKLREIIAVPVTAQGREAVEEEKEAWERHERRVDALRAAVELAKASESADDYATAVANLRKGMAVAFSEMSRLRHQTAVAKIPVVVQFLTDTTEDYDDKVVVFAHHHDVIDALQEALPNSVVADGRVPAKERQRRIDEFQNNPNVKFFIGSITACGTGITLTAASRVVFAELDWVPGNMTQAEDRCHRIGQTDTVNVQHIVFEESLDATMAERLVEKQQVIDEALDNKHDRKIQFVEDEKKNPATPGTKGTTRKLTRYTLDEWAAKLTKSDVSLIHQCLQCLAGCCDYAQARDDVGYNGVDTFIGHALAECDELTGRQAALGLKIVWKYRNTQLGRYARKLETVKNRVAPKKKKVKK